MTHWGERDSAQTEAFLRYTRGEQEPRRPLLGLLFILLATAIALLPFLVR